MQATPEQVEILSKLLEIDRSRFQAESQLNDMPHKQQVLDGRIKRKEVQLKFDQVAKLLDEAKTQRQKLFDEDERLGIKLDDIQEQINETSKDYRKVTNLTRELEGVQKRRETLAFQGKQVQERLDQVQKVYDSAAEALEKLTEREQELVADYQAKTDELSNLVKEGLALRSQLVDDLPDDVIEAYEQAMKKCGGVGLSYLQGERCSACRHVIDANRLLQVRKEAPISRCPNCKRLLVIQ